MPRSLPAGRSGGDDPDGGVAGRKLGRQKSCQRQEVLTLEVTSDSDTATNRLSKLTTRQNPSPKNSDLFYGSDTMLRENEFFDFH